MDPGVLSPQSTAKTGPTTFNLKPGDKWYLPKGSKTKIGFAPDADPAEASIVLMDPANKSEMTIHFKRERDGMRFKGNVTLSPAWGQDPADLAKVVSWDPDKAVLTIIGKRWIVDD